MILLTDGRVMVQEEATPHWHALTPDSHGSYINGTWSNLADMSFWRRYYVSGVLKDGRVIVIGGEQSGDVGDTNKGEIYNPVTNTWTVIPTPPGWTIVGDAACSVLPDGRVMIGALLTGACIIYDPVLNSWTAAASKAVRSNEETWILQHDNTIVTTQCWAPYQSEKYIISSNTWKNEGALPVTVVDPVMHEIGPGMLMYNGKTIFFGSANIGNHGKTVLYTPPGLPTGTGTWAAGPDIPQVGGNAMVSNDCPATLLPNGKVLFTTAKFMNSDWGQPVSLFEYDPVANTMTAAPAPPNNTDKLYWSRMLLLPSGEVLYGQRIHNLQVYQPGGAPQAAWRPTISSVTKIGIFFNNYLLQGTQLNGLSQANIYGDDCTAATNYPLVRLRNVITNVVYFARTYHFSTLGVATGGSLQSCQFTPPSAMPSGAYQLCVIANGISSDCVSFNYVKFTKLPWIDFVAVKLEIEITGKEVAEGDPWDRGDWVINPVIQELQTQVQSLQGSVKQLESLIKAKQLPEVGKEAAEKASEQVVTLPTDPKPKNA